MSASLAARRGRIARVRRIQHLQANALAVAAETRALTLESTAERLALLAASLVPAPGATSGAALATIGGMAERLATMRDGLTGAVAAARANASREDALRLAARLRQEGAERLGERARAAAMAAAERRAAMPRPPRRPEEDPA